MKFEKFIKEHVIVVPERKHIELTPEQYAFLNWIERCKKRGLDPFKLKVNGRV